MFILQISESCINIMKIKHVCFDLDGVLINSIEVMKLSWEGSCKKLNIQVPFSRYKEHIGIPFFDILKLLDIEKNIWEEIKNHYDYISTSKLDKVFKFEDIDKMFTVLKNKDISFSIFTSKTKKRTDEILSKYFKNVLFTKVLCPEDLGDKKGKPSGEGLDIILKELNIEKKQFLYVGDTEYDVKCAENADVNFVLANWGYGSTSENIKIINNVNDFIKFINKNS